MPLSRIDVEAQLPSEFDVLFAELDDELLWKYELIKAGEWAMVEVLPVVAVLEPRGFPGDDSLPDLETVVVARLQAIAMMQFCPAWGRRQAWLDRQKRYAGLIEAMRLILAHLGPEGLRNLKTAASIVVGSDDAGVRRAAHTKANLGRLRARAGSGTQRVMDAASDSWGEDDQLYVLGVVGSKVICRAITPELLGLQRAAS